MSTIKANTLLAADGSTTTQPSIPALDKRMAKAWVNFNGQGTVAIKDSYNVSSITDGGAGIYTVNFTNAMANTDYSVSTGAFYNGTGFDDPLIVAQDDSQTTTTTALPIYVYRPMSSALTDVYKCFLQVFGD